MQRAAAPRRHGTAVQKERPLTPGRDATEAFEDVGHSDEARAMLPKMLVGEFKGETKVKKSAGAATSAAGQQQQGV